MTPTRLVHLSDLHFGAVGTRAGVAEQIQEQVRVFDPEIVVISGDLTHRARPEQFRQAREFLDGLPFPLFLIPGNHDVPHLNPMARIFRPFDRYREHVQMELEPVYRSDGLTLTGLNTVRSARFHQGRIAEQQLADLTHIFAESSREACRVVVTHHSLIGPPGGRIKQPMPNRSRILRRLEGLGVNLVLSGHVHEAYCGSSRDFFVAGRRGIVLCQAGLGSERPRPGWVWETNTFNRVEICDDAIHVQVLAYSHHAHAFELTGDHRFPRWFP